MLYFFFICFLIAAIFVLLYLISLQNLRKQLELLKDRNYQASFPEKFCSPSTSFQSFLNTSSNEVAKKLNFQEAFQPRDKILFANQFASKSWELNKEIMGPSPKEDVNMEIINSGNRVLEIDLSKKNWPEYNELKQSFPSYEMNQKWEKNSKVSLVSEKENHFLRSNMNEKKEVLREIFRENPRETENNFKKDLFLSYRFDEKQADSFKKGALRKEKRLFSDDKENVDFNQNFGLC